MRIRPPEGGRPSGSLGRHASQVTWPGGGPLWRAAPSGTGLKRRGAPLHLNPRSQGESIKPGAPLHPNPRSQGESIKPGAPLHPNLRPQGQTPKPGARLTRAAIASEGKNPRRFWARIRTHTAQVNLPRQALPPHKIRRLCVPAPKTGILGFLPKSACRRFLPTLSRKSRRRVWGRVAPTQFRGTASARKPI